jgi:hypothetical protein
MADPPRLPGGWLPPEPPQRPEPEPARPPEPQTPFFIRPAAEQGTNGLAIVALVCAGASIVLLVFSLGLSFGLSLPLGGVGWICAAKANPDVRPSQRKAALVLAIVAVALSVIAAAVWIVLVAAGVSVEDLQHNLQRELDRQRRAGS